MVRRAAAALGLAAAFVAAVSPGARAQNLARLTVQTFVLAPNTAAPRIDVPFQLILTLRVRERVSQVANLNLPILAQLELLGDERATTSTSRGTQYRETITVVAHQAGPLSIAPATLQAIDARDGKAKQWYTNGLTLQVVGAGPQVFRDGARLLRTLAVALLWIAIWMLGIGCVVLVVVLVARRRPRAPAYVRASPPAAAPVLVVERSRRAQAEDALTVLRKERSRSAAVAVRAAIWRMVGASEGETLADVLRGPDAREDTMRRLLIALERSAFTYDDDLYPAIDDACTALQRYIGPAK